MSYVSDIAIMNHQQSELIPGPQLVTEFEPKRRDFDIFNIPRSNAQRRKARSKSPENQKRRAIGKAVLATEKALSKGQPVSKTDYEIYQQYKANATMIAKEKSVGGKHMLSVDGESVTSTTVFADQL